MNNDYYRYNPPNRIIIGKDVNGNKIYSGDSYRNGEDSDYQLLANNCTTTTMLALYGPSGKDNWLLNDLSDEISPYYTMTDPVLKNYGDKLANDGGQVVEGADGNHYAVGADGNYYYTIYPVNSHNNQAGNSSFNLGESVLENTISEKANMIPETLERAGYGGKVLKYTNSAGGFTGMGITLNDMYSDVQHYQGKNLSNALISDAIPVAFGSGGALVGEFGGALGDLLEV